MKVDPVTKRWIRNASDEQAVANGCRFDEARGQHVIDFAAQFLKLYEGEFAGEPLIARDWQIEAAMRLFGWVRHSERWGREVRRFTRASIWVPKKNKKSPTLAWWGLYLLVADGEQGQKVFFGAKDGAQAREIAGKHAIEMVLASPGLSSECSINKSLMQITHNPTRSILKPMSSSDSKSQKAKEGLNGSILVDETHVVDRAFMSRVSRAGISRSEPLQIEVSTAGNDPMSYGKSQYDYGKEVEAGTREDQSLLFISYEAPQNLTDTELAKDPVRYGKMANPAWGHTVAEEEFLDDYRRSRKSLTDLAEFKMYRLNIWLSSSNPFLRQEDWQACYEDFDVSELEGTDCIAGLDLSLKWDTTSLVLLFPQGSEDEETKEYKLLTYFWLPSDTAHEQRQKVKWQDWQAAGDIELTEGNVTDFPLVHRAIVAASKRFNLLAVAYDERFAAPFIQRLQDEEAINCINFPQSTPAFGGPTEMFERLVVSHRIKHRGNRVMDWQCGNVAVKEVNKCKRPVKPENNPMAKIDGVVSSIMALGVYMTNPDLCTVGGVEAW